MARLKHALIGAAALTTAIAAPASAATFTLIDSNGSVANTPAERGFKIAAAYWSSVLSTNSNIRLEIGYNALAPNIIGSTGSTRANIPTSAVVAQMNATGNSALDTLAMSTVQLSAAGGISMI